MSIQKIKANGLPFANVAATGVATANIEICLAVERIQLILGGTTFNETHMQTSRCVPTASRWWI